VTLTKSDVPYAMRPWSLMLMWGLPAWIYLYLVITDSTVRPGYAESGLGVLFALPAGLAYSTTSVMYVRELSELCRGNPRMKLLGPIYYMGIRAAWIHFAVTLAVIPIGLWGLSMTLEILRLRYPQLMLAGLSPSLSATAQQEGSFSLLRSTTLVCLGGIVSLTMWRLIRWYNSLPCD
jgi:hypothetical protein